MREEETERDRNRKMDFTLPSKRTSRVWESTPAKLSFQELPKPKPKPKPGGAGTWPGGRRAGKRASRRASGRGPN